MFCSHLDGLSSEYISSRYNCTLSGLHLTPCVTSSQAAYPRAPLSNATYWVARTIYEYMYVGLKKRDRTLDVLWVMIMPVYCQYTACEGAVFCHNIRDSVDPVYYHIPPYFQNNVAYTATRACRVWPVSCSGYSIIVAYILFIYIHTYTNMYIFPLAHFSQTRQYTIHCYCPKRIQPIPLHYLQRPKWFRAKMHL